ncbi:hypothetical protein A2U01_0062304, partial [Trifolium medium]|nr:hypothetical protein [Trifolium medium]
HIVASTIAKATESLVASAIMFAQETVAGHAFSRTSFISSMRSNPLSVPFAPDSFSD